MHAGTLTSKTDAMTTMCEITARSDDGIVSCFDQCDSLDQCLGELGFP